MTHDANEVAAIRIKTGREDRPYYAVALCPHCGQLHRHTVKKGPLPEILWRQSHCTDGTGRAYRLRIDQERPYEFEAVAILRRNRRSGHRSRAA